MPTMRETKPEVGPQANRPGWQKPAPMAIASRLRNDIQHFGVVKTAYEFGMEGINRLVDLRVMRISKKEQMSPEVARGGEAFQWGFLDQSRVLELAQQPENRVSESLMHTAFEKGDDCWGALDGESLAFHCWYSNEPTDDNGLLFHFRSDYKYAYSAAANPNYRGRGLYVISGNRVLRELHARGYKGMVFSTDSHNLHAVRAAASFGVEHIGNIVALKFGQRAWIHTSRGCREHGCFLTKSAAAEPVSTV